jgi:hypothetical protein
MGPQLRPEPAQLGPRAMKPGLDFVVFFVFLYFDQIRGLMSRVQGCLIGRIREQRRR